MKTQRNDHVRPLDENLPRFRPPTSAGMNISFCFGHMETHRKLPPPNSTLNQAAPRTLILTLTPPLQDKHRPKLRLLVQAMFVVASPHHTTTEAICTVTPHASQNTLHLPLLLLCSLGQSSGTKKVHLMKSETKV